METSVAHNGITQVRTAKEDCSSAREITAALFSTGHAMRRNHVCGMSNSVCERLLVLARENI
jgi:hypothetical protein